MYVVQNKTEMTIVKADVLVDFSVKGLAFDTYFFW